MAPWFSRLFRSRSEVLAEKAEVEGRFDDAARLYAESGARGEAFRVLMRAAECARHLSDRRGFITRAYAIARTDEARASAKKALGLVTLAEAEVSAPRNDEEKARLLEAASDLERGGAFREAAQAYKMLGERDSMERVLMLSGDVEGFEREAGADQIAERYRLRRHNAIESFEALWRSGDRANSIGVLEAWLRENDDSDARTLLDGRRGQVVTSGSFEAQINGIVHNVIGRFPVTLGREGDVIVRGASVSREHCIIEQDGTKLCVRDNASRNGTQLAGINVAGSVALAVGHTVGLGTDLLMRVDAMDAGATVLQIERGMDRGKRIVLLHATWVTPIGTVRFDGQHAVFEPSAPVQLLGQRVVASITLARGDRLEGNGAKMDVLR